ncbi:MAG: GNAT family N-acetyltransferase [Bacteroidales bacterium]|nr:GNAT family N-acetyltransferase [Bacteroidales bacterium]
MITVREGTPGDAPVLLVLLDKIDKKEKSFLAFNMKSTLIKAQIKTGKHIIIALDDGRAVGFARESGRPNNSSMLEEIYVDPDYRGKGVATAIINYMNTKFDSIQGKIKSDNTNMINLAKNQGFEVIKTTPKGTVSMWEKRAAELLGIQKEAKKDKDVSGAGIGTRVGAEYGAVTGGLAGAALGNVNANVLERTLPQLVHISPEMRQLYGVTPEIFESLSEESRFILDKGIRRKMLGAMALTGTAAGAAGGALPGAITGTVIKQNVPRDASGLKTTAVGAGTGFGTGAILPAILSKGRKPIPIVVGGAVGAVPGALIGHAISDAREKKASENYIGGNNMYRELLDIFKEAAGNVSAEELELFADEVLEEMVKEAGFLQLRKEHDLAVDELDREYLALKQQDDGRAKQRLDIFMDLAGRAPNREERKALQDLATKEFWATIDKVAPNHAALQEYMVSKDPRFHRKDTALDAAGLAGGLGAAVGGIGGALAGAAGGNYIIKGIPLSSKAAAKIIGGEVVGGGLRGAGVGGALGAAGGALLGYAAGTKPDKDALIRLENKSAFYSDLLNGFEKVAAELSDEELEVLSTELLDELLKIAKDDNEIGAWEGAKAGAKTGTILGGVGGALAGASAGNILTKGIPLHPKVMAKIIGGGALGVGTVGAVGGGVAGGAFGAPVGHVLGKKEQKRNNNLTVKVASEQSYLEKEAFPKIMNPKQFVDSLRTGAKSTQQAADNAVNAAGAAAQKTTKTTKAETSKVKNKPEGSFIKRHPYVSTLAGVGVGATIPGITSAVQQAGASAVPVQPPQYYQ